MNEPFSLGVRHPVSMRTEALLLTDEVMLAARDARGNEVVIVASRQRWRDALEPRLGPAPSRTETVRAMYERGEVEVDAFEAALERELRWGR